MNSAAVGTRELYYNRGFGGSLFILPRGKLDSNLLPSKSLDRTVMSVTFSCYWHMTMFMEISTESHAL